MPEHENSKKQSTHNSLSFTWSEPKSVSTSLNSSLDTEPPKTLRAQLLSGSFMLLAGSGSVTAINFLYNIAVARFLGPSGFGHVSAVCTLLILISAVTLSFQIVSAKIVAQQESLPAKRAAYRGFHRRAWICGVLAGLFLVLFRHVISNYLNLPNPVLVVVMGIGAAFYVPLGSRRGYLQGACRFRHLAFNVVIEGLVRLGGSLLLIELGFGATGVIAANAAAFVIAYICAIPTPAVAIAYELGTVSVAFREGLQAIVFFVGAVVINNCDIVLVKHFFAPPLAGLYAAVALVGRVIYVLSWSVVSGMFPIAAGSRSQKKRDHGVLTTSLLLVLAIGASITLGLWLAPAGIWTKLFGLQFGMAAGHSLPYLLMLYAATTSVYSLCIVFIAYEMSHKIANTGWVQLAFSGVLIASIYGFHSSLEQVIRVQLVMMLFLLVVVAVPFVLSALLGSKETQGNLAWDEIRTIRRVSENEVIAEFLKTDFHKPEFRKYQQTLGEVVTTPNLSDVVENAVRQALLFVRHGALWRELPAGTQWFEVEIESADLERIRVFPRAQWRRLARGNFDLTEISQRIATGDCNGVADESFLLKIQQLRNRLGQDWDPGAVLLIGLNQTGPFTLLDGNHRMVAAMLASPEALARFRFFCALSPKMSECCWYETNVATLARYGKNLVRHVVSDPHTELERLLQGF
jgi:O-antigen/teichoic acid export membrane protein